MTESSITEATCANYEYKYTVDDASYYSPITIGKWKFDEYFEATGTWRYDGNGSFECIGGEKGNFGVGCSNGVGLAYKVFPLKQKFDSVAGTARICQDKPKIWKEVLNCVNAQVYFRCSDGRLM